MELDKQIEAILFWKGEPMTLADLCRALKAPSDEVKKALHILSEKLQGRGIAIIQTEEEIALATAPIARELIERVLKEELSKDLSKAALETLSIILYKGSLSRREIEYIRGVNSTTILRSLSLRGLVERTQSKIDERQFLYRGAVELYALLGITKAEDLPEFAAVQKELNAVNLESEGTLSPEDGESSEEVASETLHE
ncbi:MAG TPA: hypothetical protein DEF00_01600 [Candidatus Taylorbacteria bacterium]|nr:MAG: Chromosome segregation and condensation protein, ScpB [Parcubacteria group bacterium GW2011_GWA2_47_64]KKU96746.1 MAG: Chromosome segregation and condensation protein, ScpB [Parcubacteria group bacterium GW2011_GWC2_48_17]HBV01071.1 hypothetical protein [Candidatus Taylorbacteria bacterium]